MIVALFLIAVSIVVAAPPGSYLSIFGQDSNDGLSANTPVKTLGRAFAVMNAQKFGYIYVAPGSYPMETLSVPSNTQLALVGSQNQPGLTKFSCQGNLGAAINAGGGANVTLDSVSIEACTNPIYIGTTYYTYNYNLFMYNVLMNQNNIDIRLNSGNTRVFISGCMFSSGASALSVIRDYSASTNIDVQVVNSKIAGYASNDYAFKFDPAPYNTNFRINVNFTAVSFQTPSGFIKSGAYSSLFMNSVSFQSSSFSGCGVNLYGGMSANILKTTFSGKTGGPPVCIAGSATVTTQQCEFSNNNVSSSAFNGAAGAVYVQGAVYATSNSLYRGNTVDAGEGAGIHCDGSHLTVGQSTFTSNKAPDAPAASCLNCVLVAFGNTVSRNSGGVNDACAL